MNRTKKKKSGAKGGKQENWWCEDWISADDDECRKFHMLE